MDHPLLVFGLRLVVPKQVGLKLIWEDAGRLLGGQGYFIIVGDYVVFRFFTRPAEPSACNCTLMNPRRNPFAPFVVT
jgi:hypothetical protein